MRVDATVPSPPSIGPFAIGDVIARGGHSVVHAATWNEGSTHAAIELVAKVAVRGAEVALHKENAALRAVEHSNVIVPVGFADDGERAALVLPRAACSLRAHAGRLEPGHVAPVVVAIAGALAALHRGGFVHGDVSTGNILLFDDGSAVLSDLGSVLACSAAAVRADVQALARAAGESLQSTAPSPFQDLLASLEAGPCAAEEVAQQVAALGVVPQRIDVYAAPPVSAEPPTMMVDPQPF